MQGKVLWSLCWLSRPLPRDVVLAPDNSVGTAPAAPWMSGARWLSHISVARSQRAITSWSGALCYSAWSSVSYFAFGRGVKAARTTDLLGSGVECLLDPIIALCVHAVICDGESNRKQNDRSSSVVGQALCQVMEIIDLTFPASAGASCWLTVNRTGSCIKTWAVTEQIRSQPGLKAERKAFSKPACALHHPHAFAWLCVCLPCML